MNRVIAVVEGQTEQTFIRDVLAPHLALEGIFITARLVGKPGRKGGVGSYHRARRDILAVLKQEADVYCTTMFDYYGMPHSWPGRSYTNVVFEQKAELIEQAIAEDVRQQMGESFDLNRFIPYVQMHEYEALLFSDPDTLAQTMQQPHQANELHEIINQFGSPEMINDNFETAPSKRLEKLFPTYEKVLYGTLIANRVSLAVMREKCSHFDEWLIKLEEIGVSESA